MNSIGLNIRGVVEHSITLSFPCLVLLDNEDIQPHVKDEVLPFIHLYFPCSLRMNALSDEGAEVIADALPEIQALQKLVYVCM